MGFRRKIEYRDASSKLDIPVYILLHLIWIGIPLFILFKVASK